LWNESEAQRKDFIARKYAEQGKRPPLSRGSMERSAELRRRISGGPKDLRVARNLVEEIVSGKQKNSLVDGSLAREGRVWREAVEFEESDYVEEKLAG